MAVAAERQEKTAGEVRLCSASFAGMLDSGENLASVVSVLEEGGSSDLTIDNETVSDAELLIDGELVPTARAVQFRVSGGVARKTYPIRIQALTTSVPQQTLELIVHLQVKP